MHHFRRKCLKVLARLHVEPADNLKPEFDLIKEDLKEKAKNSQLFFGDNIEDDTLTYALFPQIALNFFENKNDPSAFEPMPKDQISKERRSSKKVKPWKSKDSFYRVEVDGEKFDVKVSESDEFESIASQSFEERSLRNPREESRLKLKRHLEGTC